MSLKGTTMSSTRRFLLLLVLALCGTVSSAADTLPTPKNLWDAPRLLEKPIEAEWGNPQGLIREVYYDGAPLADKPTRVFAYYAQPEGKGPFPAMLLIHGGGGKAFSDWAQLWAKRGYAALAMDTAGCGPGGARLADGGPDQSDEQKFREFTPENARDMWTYHAVAAALRGHALLMSRPEVDKERIGVTGISWGGYLTCIVAGIDDRLKVAVPVYGCGFLNDNSAWLRNGLFSKQTPEIRQRWCELFDPSRYLPGVKCPMLWVNGTNDFAYPLDSYQKSYRVVTAPTTLSITIEMPHGHLWDQTPIVEAFVDSVLKGGEPLPRLGSTTLKGDMATTEYEGATAPTKTELVYTSDIGDWEKRKWKSMPATFDVATYQITAKLPELRPLTFYFNALDERGYTVSSEHMSKD